jgi:crotonobetainyl-CoA:carnitine CoA-transferase CaiB-like acyl-CoA transferase
VNRPLEGLKVLTLEQYGAGPYGTQLLAELGADVVKLEVRAAGGDVARGIGPYFCGEDDSLFFQTFSRGKKSITLDIRDAEDRRRFEALVAKADLVANNLRGTLPSVLALDYAGLSAFNPAIVCAHLSGYGRDTSRAAWPGYDYLMQAEAGFMELTGEPDGPPARFGLSLVDFMSGAMLAVGALAKILDARATGIGGDVDVSLFDTALHQLTYLTTWSLNSGHIASRLPRGAHPSIAPSQRVRTADGWGMLMCQTPAIWRDFCRIVEREDLLADPRFAETADRHANLEPLSEAMDAIFAQKSSQEWQALLGGKIPFAPVLDLAAALANPFIAESGLIQTVEHPACPDGLRMLAMPIKIDGEQMPGRRSPTLGEHDGLALWGVA